MENLAFVSIEPNRLIEIVDEYLEFDFNARRFMFKNQLKKDLRKYLRSFKGKTLLLVRGKMSLFSAVKSVREILRQGILNDYFKMPSRTFKQEHSGYFDVFYVGTAHRKSAESLKESAISIQNQNIELMQVDANILRIMTSHRNINV